tara:strand:- start:546 stop:767 length:222 start_codon:yes stop_codon:yes gene_type:complete
VISPRFLYTGTINAKIVNALLMEIAAREKLRKGLRMPIRKVKGGWTFGGAVYKTLAAAKRSYKAYLAKTKKRK